MPWVPQYVITNGALKGVTPEGSLNDLTNYFVAGIITETAGCHSNGPRYYSDNDDPYIWWSGAYGSNGLLIRDYAPTGSRFLYAELPVEKKENAPYWRQTICVYGEIRKRELTNDDNIYYEYSYELTGFTRKVYQREGDTVPISEEALYSVDSGIRYIIGHYDGVIPRYNAEFKTINIAFGWITVGQERYWGCAFYCTRLTELSGINTRMSNGCYLMAVSETQLLNRFDVDEFKPQEKDDPNEDDDNKGDDEDGGNGDHDKTEDPVPVPDLPVIGAASAGFITMYCMTVARMQTFASDLFADILDPTKAWQNIKLIFGDPMDFIAGCVVVPFSPTTGAWYKPKFGLFTWQNGYPTIENQFQELDFGSLLIPKFYNTAFDYNPFTKIELWLPFCGYKTLDPDDVMGKYVHIKYHVDCLTGDCAIFIYTTIPTLRDPAEQVIAQFSGNCAVRVPIGEASYDSAVNAGIRLLGSMAGNIVGAANIMSEGAGGAPTEDTLTGAAKSFTVGAINSMKVNTQRSGVAGASAGYMGVMKPYIIRHIANQSLPSQYMRLNGYPSNISGNLGSFSGFNQLESIELNNVAATEDEKKEIISLLRGGCII